MIGAGTAWALVYALYAFAGLWVTLAALLATVVWLVWALEHAPTVDDD
jgi:hypothetical protein